MRIRGVALGVASAVALSFGGCSGGYDIDTDPALLDAAGYTKDGVDASCNPDDANQGDLCTQDCDLGPNSCNSSRGRRYCTCEGGVYVQCQCLPPDNWPYKDVPAAPYCDSISGEPRYLMNAPCTKAGVGTTCRGRKDPTMGAVCMAAAGGGAPTWTSGTVAALGVSENAAACEDFGTGMVYDSRNVFGPHNKQCDTDWELCIGRDVNQESTSPRGCVCWPEASGLKWLCVATQRWFRAQ
jgi:hypothetical protein